MESILLTVFANAQSLDKASASGSSEDTLEKRSLMNAKTCFFGGQTVTKYLMICNKNI